MNRTVALLSLASLIAFGAATASAALPSLEFLPFTFTGRIVDYAHIAYDSDTTVEVRVKAKDGTLLAKTTTTTSGTVSYNYSIDIPLASQAVSGHVKVGDEVVFEFVDPEDNIFSGIVPTSAATIGLPGQVSKVDVILASDADKDGVPDDYVEELAFEMWMNDIETYDAKADYDGDGVSNYAEYVAGTNPFDATDKFTVHEMAMNDGLSDYFALEFFASQGRTYTLLSTTALDGGTASWSRETFAVDSPASALQGRLSTSGDLDGLGNRILYVKKEGDRRFYQVNVE